MNSPPSSSADSEFHVHPFAHSTGQLEILTDGIDVEEESRFYDSFCEDEERQKVRQKRRVSRQGSPPIAASIFSRDIWLGDGIGESKAFARDVKISGWTNVGDKGALGAYVVYDCVITTKEGTTIHVHKRYNAFCQLASTLRRTVPASQYHFIPPLPPKSALARYRPVFLNRRRTLLQYWLSAVLLHPDLGSSSAVRSWIME